MTLDKSKLGLRVETTWDKFNKRPLSGLPAATRISIAKGRLVQTSPFFSTILYNLPLIITEAVPTAAVSGTTMYFNPNFARRLTALELAFVLCHEAMHICLGHTWRMRGWHKKTANIAQDLIVNEILLESLPKTKAQMPQEVGANLGVFDPVITKAGGYTAEGVYHILLQMAAQGGKGTPEGQELDEILSAEEARQRGLQAGTSQSQAELEARIQTLVGQAAVAEHRKAGNTSKGLERIIQTILHPQVPWQTLLQRFCVARMAEREERSWRRFNRRGFSTGIMMPSAQPGESLGPIAIAIDCSGSIGDKELSEFATEIQAIMADCRPSSMHLIYFDSAVCREETFQAGESVIIRPSGGGGTQFSPAIAAALAAPEEPEVIIFLTDLESSDFGPIPPVPVLWVSTSQHCKAPFGTVIQMHAGSG